MACERVDLGKQEDGPGELLVEVSVIRGHLFDVRRGSGVSGEVFIDQEKALVR